MSFSIEPGTAVEVRSSFDSGWKRGFVVADTDDCGYRLRRLSDGSILPAAFSPDVVRPAVWEDNTALPH